MVEGHPHTPEAGQKKLACTNIDWRWRVCLVLTRQHKAHMCAPAALIQGIWWGYSGEDYHECP